MTYVWVIPQSDGSLVYRVVHHGAVVLDTANALKAVRMLERLKGER